MNEKLYTYLIDSMIKALKKLDTNKFEENIKMRLRRMT